MPEKLAQKSISEQRKTTFFHRSSKMKKLGNCRSCKKEVSLTHIASTKKNCLSICCNKNIKWKKNKKNHKKKKINMPLTWNIHCFQSCCSNNIYCDVYIFNFLIKPSLFFFWCSMWTYRYMFYFWGAFFFFKISKYILFKQKNTFSWNIWKWILLKNLF